MKTERSRPPRLAVWFLRRLYPKRNREAITGDLLERFREGRSDSWFWRQVLVAIFFGVSSQLKLTDICFAAAGTALIWGFPWGDVFPLEAMTTSMNWDARLEWLLVIEIVTALMVLPLFAVIFRPRRTFGWANLLRVFFVSTMLFAAGDLPILWRNSSHPVASRSEATWAVALQLGWFFAALLISARIARRLTSPSKTIPT